MKLFLIILLVIIVAAVGFFIFVKKSVPLVSPILKQQVLKKNVSAKPSPTPQPTVFNNPPKEIRYDSQTDLKRELDSINPQVSESDFE